MDANNTIVKDKDGDTDDEKLEEIAKKMAMAIKVFLSNERRKHFKIKGYEEVEENAVQLEIPEANCKSGQELDKHLNEASVWKIENMLQDGFLLPPTDPKKLDKLTRKQVRDTFGPKWFRSKPGQRVDKHSKETSVRKIENQLLDGLLVPPTNPKKLNKLARKQVKDTLGPKWFDMPAQVITPELKKDLQLLKLRNVVDPKRHYKADDSKGLPKYFQVGTVIEPATEFYSGRLTKKEQKPTIADELLSNLDLSGYRKRKYAEIDNLKNTASRKGRKMKKHSHKHGR